MKRLYWRRLTDGFGKVEYHLLERTEIAVKGKILAIVNSNGWAMPDGPHGLANSTRDGKNQVEKLIDRESIGRFGCDDVRFLPWEGLANV